MEFPLELGTGARDRATRPRKKSGVFSLKSEFFSRLDTTDERDGRTDRQTIDRQADSKDRAYAASRDKNQYGMIV